MTNIKLPFPHSHAFIIGINAYQNGISHLTTAVKDATKADNQGTFVAYPEGKDISSGRSDISGEKLCQRLMQFQTQVVFILDELYQFTSAFVESKVADNLKERLSSTSFDEIINNKK